ncbi:MAG: AAA family ATPase, partial [Pseudomonadota bacterium]|nr:AAA family ATPase [Pseudomonadota bacterium]
MTTASVTSLAVTRLRLTEFRNYSTLSLDLAPVPVVATGPNGAGKTNLLEAISFLAPGRGLRQARLSDIELRLPGAQKRPFGSDGWAVAATIETVHGPVEIGTGRVPPDEKRIIRIGGASAKSQSA